MKRQHHVVALSAMFLSLVLGLAACGQSQAGANEVSMTVANFTTSALTIKVGQTVQFTDPVATGGMHVVCLGSDGTCQAGAPGPFALQGEGFTINAGDSAKSVTFATAGTYKITCSIHPNMNLTVALQ